MSINVEVCLYLGCIIVLQVVVKRFIKRNGNFVAADRCCKELVKSAWSCRCSASYSLTTVILNSFDC